MGHCEPNVKGAGPCIADQHVVGLLLGATFFTLGPALQRAGVFAPWTRWTALVAGAVGTVLGAMMLVDVALGFAFCALRVVGLVVTVVAIAVGVQLYRGKVAVPEEPTAAGT